MKLTIKKNDKVFEQEYINISMDEVKNLVKAFMTIYKLDDCSWLLEGTGQFEIDTSESQGLGCLFG